MRNLLEITGTAFRRIVLCVLNVIFPENCAICGIPLWLTIKKPWALCPACEGDLLPLTGMRCSKCGRPLISEKGLCMKCRTGSMFFDIHRSVFVYGDCAKKLLVRYKFNETKSLVFFFSAFVAEIVKELSVASVLVPVPCSRAGLKKRGWDQALLITSALHRNYGFSSAKLLSRKGTKAQKTLSAEDRGKNLKGHIGLLRGKKIPHTVILIDDVYTTGSTISECSAVLKSAGVERVFAITLMMDL